MKQYEYFLIMTTLAVGANVAIEKLQQQYNERFGTDTLSHCQRQWNTTDTKLCITKDTSLINRVYHISPKAQENMTWNHFRTVAELAKDEEKSLTRK